MANTDHSLTIWRRARLHTQYGLHESLVSVTEVLKLEDGCNLLFPLKGRHE